MREICVLGCVLYTLFGILDLWAIPSALAAVWLIRALVVVMLIGILWATHRAFFVKRYLLLSVCLYIGMGLGIEAMVYLSGQSDLARHFYYTGLILVVMAIYTWSFLMLWQNAVMGLALVAIYLLISLGVHGMTSSLEWPVLLTNCFFFVSAIVLGVFSNIQRDRYLRASFLLHQNLMTDLQRSEEEKKKSQYWSEHDTLTGLPNRKHLMQQLEVTLTRARSNNTLLALLFIDLDNFKPVNDQHGHACGDAVLSVVGKRIARCVRENDLLARIGGDEFVVALTVEPGQMEAAPRLAKSIISSIESPIRDPDIGSTLSASIGVAYFPHHAATASALLAAADEQMYAAKRQGRGSVCVMTKT